MNTELEIGLSVLNYCFTILFALELVIKLIGLGPERWWFDKLKVFIKRRCKTLSDLPSITDGFNISNEAYGPHTYYTSFEFEEQALTNCPFSEFIIRADSSGFCTIISITNDEFENVLRAFPGIKRKILKDSKNINMDETSSQYSMSQSQSISKQNTRGKSLISSNADLLIDNVEINFDDTITPNDTESQSIDNNNNNNRRKRSTRLSLANVTIGNHSITSKKQMPNLNNFYEYFGLIHPLSDIKLFWNIISLLFCLYNMMIIPYRIAFYEANNFNFSIGFILFDIILDVFFCCDVYMRLDRFTFIEEGFVEPNKTVIRNKYIGYKLILDLISSFPWDFILIISIIQPQSFMQFWLSDKIKIFFWLRFFRLLRCHNFSSHISEIDQFIEDRRIRIKPAMLRIIYQLIFVLMVCHWGASLFYFIAKETSINNSNNWLNNELALNATIPKYLLSWYWSLITMSSVGFGDIKPQTISETCCGLIVMVLGVLAYACNLYSNEIESFN